MSDTQYKWRLQPKPTGLLDFIGPDAGGVLLLSEMSPVRDTIFALSSGRPPAAIAVVRISGPQAGAALEALTGRRPEPRKAALARVRDPQNGEKIDEALALWFPAPRSETGEDMAELQLHGGRAVIAAVLRALGTLPGCRLAEAGEFTRRAFGNGKLDLTRVEGLADLIAADTEAQRRQALRQLSGALGDRAESWRKRLIEAMALIEARIDFSDEGDVPDDLVGPALAIARDLRGEIDAVLAQGDRGERLREGLVVAIAGPPNVGKSSLLNRLVRREAAIVSPVAGTTRDVIEVHLDVDGYPVTFLDTAGMRESADPVEQEGIRRARERAAAADLVLWVIDASEKTGINVNGLERDLPGTETWVVANKIDLASEGGRDAASGIVGCGAGTAYRLSAKSGAGLEALWDALRCYAGQFVGTAEPALVTRERHRRSLAETSSALSRALADDLNGREEMIAEELRLAARALGRLLGRVDVEDILDVIFRDFCIGK
jgi:tRNA modification GTPase